MASQQAQYIVLTQNKPSNSAQPQLHKLGVTEIKAKRGRKHMLNKQTKKASLVVNLNKEQMRSGNNSSLRQRQSTQKSVREQSRGFQRSAQSLSVNPNHKIVSVDGVLYHAVDINEIPDNAVVFAAANQSMPDPKQIDENEEDGEDYQANLEKILKSFSKDRKKYKLRNKRKNDPGTLSLSDALNIPTNGAKKSDVAKSIENAYFDINQF